MSVNGLLLLVDLQNESNIFDSLASQYFYFSLLGTFAKLTKASFGGQMVQIRGGGVGQPKMCIPPDKILGTPLSLASPPVGRRGAIYLFKWFLPAVAALWEGGGGGSAPCDLDQVVDIQRF